MEEGAALTVGQTCQMSVETMRFSRIHDIIQESVCGSLAMTISSAVFTAATTFCVKLVSM
jgi:hypothetical protein